MSDTPVPDPLEEAFDIEVHEDAEAAPVPVVPPAPAADAPAAEAPVAEAAPEPPPVVAEPPSPAMLLRAEAEAWLKEAALASNDLATRLKMHAGLLYERAGDPEKALEIYAGLRETSPGYRPAIDGQRRASGARGDWLAVADSFTAELEFVKDNAARFELLRARASLLSRRAGRADLASAALEKALELAPDHPALVPWAIEQARANHDEAKEAQLRLRAAGSLRDDRLKARELSFAARLLESSGDMTASADAYTKLFAVDPSDIEAQASVMPDVLKRKDAESLEKIGRAEIDASSGSPTRVRLARVIAERRGAFDDADELLKLAREINPRDNLAVEAMVDVADRRGDPAKLLAALTLRADTARDPRDKAYAALRASRLSETMGDVPGAIQFATRVLESVPEHPEATSTIRRLEGASASPDEKIARAMASLAAAADEPARARIAYDLGVSLEQAGRPDEAAMRYRMVLESDPQHLAARNAIVRLLSGAGRHADVAEIFAREAAAATDPAVRREAFLAVAETLEIRLADYAGALAAYKSAVELVVEDIAVEGARRNALRLGDNVTLESALRLLAGGLSASPEVSARRKVTLLDEAARLALGRGDDVSAAREFKAALALDPTYEPARRHVHGAASDDGVTSVASAIESARAETDATRRAQLLNEATRLGSQGTPEEAEAGARALTASFTTHPTAWLDVARATFLRGEFALAATAHERHAGIIGDAISKADRLFRAAEIAAEWALDPARAEALCETATTAYPRHAPAWRLAARLALSRGDVEKAAKALEQEANVSQLKDRALARLRLARLLAGRLNRRAEAVTTLQELVEADPQDLPVQFELEAQLNATGALAKSAELRGKLAAKCTDPRAAAAMRTTAAEDRFRAGDADGSLGDWRRALAVDPRNRLAAEEILIAARAKGDRQTQIDTLLRIGNFFDNDTQAVFLVLRAQLHDAENQEPLALRAYRDATSADGLFVPAMRSARMIHEKNNEWKEARALLSQEGEVLPDLDEGVALIVRAGEIAEKLRETETAEAHYVRALERKPGHIQALARLDAFLRPQGRFDELVVIYEREGEATQGPPSATLYAEAAWLRYEKLGEDRRAIVPMNRALARDPGCIRALELKAVLAMASGNAEDAGQALQAVLAAAKPEDRPRLYARQAEALLAAGRPSDAIEAAQAASEADPTSFEYLELVAKAALEAKAFLVAVATGEKLLGMAGDFVNGSKYAKFAGRIRRLAGDVQGASELYRRALGFMPGDKEAIEGLEGVHTDANDLPGLAAAYEALAATPGVDKQSSLQYLSKAAAAWDRAKQPDKAAGVWRATIKADPTNLGARLALARSLAVTNKLDAATELRGIILADVKQAEAWRTLLELFEGAGKKDGAFLVRACLVATGLATPQESAAYSAASAKLPPGPQGALSPEDFELAVHPAERASPVRELIGGLPETLSKIFPGNLESRGLSKNDRVKGDWRTFADRLLKLFGGGEIDMLQTAREPQRAWVENTVPPSIVIGAQLMTAGVGELLFVLGMLIGRVRMRNQAAYFAQPIEIANLTAELLRQVDPTFARFGTKNDDFGKLITKVLPRGERKIIEGVMPRFAGPVNFGAYTQAMHHTAHRFGLLAAGDPAAAARAMGQLGVGAPEQPAFRELMAFAVSEEHLALRAKIKTSIG